MDAGQRMQRPRRVVKPIGPRRGGRKDDEVVDEVRPNPESINDRRDDKGRVLAEAKGDDGVVHDGGIRVGNVKTDGEGCKRVEGYDAEADFASGNLDGFFRSKVLVLSRCDSDGFKADHAEEAGRHGFPNAEEAAGTSLDDFPVGKGHISGSERVWFIVSPEGSVLDRLLNVDNDVEEDEDDDEEHLGSAEEVLQSAKPPHREHVENQHDEKETNDVDGGRRAGIEFECGIRVFGRLEELLRVPELENVSYSDKLGRYKHNPGKPIISVSVWGLFRQCLR